METPVTFTVRGQQVVGMLHTPGGGDGPWPAVVHCHGFTGSKPESHRLYVQTARRLTDEGVASLRFDFRGAGDSAGESQDITVQTQHDDARAALGFIREQEGMDLQRIGILGMSMGGAVAATMLGEDEDIKAGVLWCPVGYPDQLVGRRAGPKATAQFVATGIFDMDGWAVGAGLARELLEWKPLEDIKNTRADVLIMHGDQDESVPVEESADYLKALEGNGRVSERRVIKGSGHNYDSLPWQKKLLGRTVDWFTKKL